MATSPLYAASGIAGGALPKKASGLLGLLGINANPITDFLGDHSNALIGFGAGLAGGGPDLGQAVGSALQYAGQGKTADYTKSEKTKADAQLAQQQNQTQAWLAKNRPDLANLPVDQAWQLAMKDQGGTNADPSDVATYKFYSKQETDAGRPPKSFADWYAGSKQAAKASLGQPVWGKSKKDGSYLPFQPMSDGSYASPADPNANANDFVFDPGSIASDKAAGGAFGGLQGVDQYNLPKTQQDIETELGNIDALLGNSSGLDQSFGNLGGVNVGGVGFPNQWTPTLPNTPKAGFQAQLSQVAGENFLNAYATLRGAGAITENEGQAAKDAMARLSSAQSKEDFTKALGDLKAILVRGYETLKTKTTGGPYRSSGFTPPQLNAPQGSGDPELDRALQQYGGQ